MEATDVMMEDHKNIRRMTNHIMKPMIKKMRNERTVDEQDLRDVVDFCRNYADQHHHMKEEKVLFKELLRVDPFQFDGMINQVMLVEHDEGRQHATGMLEALEAWLKDGDDLQLDNIIIEMSYYVNTLNEHTEKEDECLYVFANNALNQASKDKVDALCRELENKDIADGVNAKYESLLDRLEAKYAM